MTNAKDKLMAHLPDAAIDYRIATFESVEVFSRAQIEQAWADGARWGFNAAHAPASAAEPIEVDDIAFARVLVDTPPNEDGWCCCTPLNHPDDVASGKLPEVSIGNQIFAQVFRTPSLTEDS